MMTVAAILVLIVKLPFLAVGYILKNKALLVVIIVGIGIFALVGFFNGKADSGSMEVTAMQKKMPDIPQAPRVVQTESRFYPYATIDKSGEYPVLTDYYFYNSGKWEHSDKPLPLIGRVSYYNRY